MECLTATFLGYSIGALAPDFEIGQAMAPPIIVIFVIYTGVFINNDSLPPGSEWLSYISFIKWAFAGITINEYTDKDDFEAFINVAKPSDVLDMFGIG